MLLMLLPLAGAIILPVIEADGRDDDVDITYPSYAFGKTYTTVIREDAVRKSPVWLETAENPPVSVRKAITLADAKRRQLVRDTERFTWRRESVAVEFFFSREKDQPYKHPYWHVHYEAHDRYGGTGIPNNLDLFVLMDGSLVEPTVTDSAHPYGEEREPKSKGKANK
jgi:hypothetical protein